MGDSVADGRGGDCGRTGVALSDSQALSSAGPPPFVLPVMLFLFTGQGWDSNPGFLAPGS